MTFDFSEKGKVKVDMINYMAAMVDDFSTKFKPDDTAPNPAAEDFFAEDSNDDLDTLQASKYHTFFCKGNVRLQEISSIYWTHKRRVVHTRKKSPSERLAQTTSTALIHYWNKKRQIYFIP